MIFDLFGKVAYRDFPLWENLNLPPSKSLLEPEAVGMVKKIK